MIRKVCGHFLALVGVNEPDPPVDIPCEVRVDAINLVKHLRTAPDPRRDIEIIMPQGGDALGFLEHRLACS